MSGTSIGDDGVRSPVRHTEAPYSLMEGSRDPKDTLPSTT